MLTSFDTQLLIERRGSVRGRRYGYITENIEE